MTKKIEITWIDDYYDCEQCGGAGASGAVVKVDGETVVDMTPQAHCFGGVDYSENQVFLALLGALGYEVKQVDGPIWEDE